MESGKLAKIKIIAVLLLIVAVVSLFVFFSLSSGKILDRWLISKSGERAEENQVDQTTMEALPLPGGTVLVFSQGRQLMALKENGSVIEVANFPEVTAGADLTYRRVGKGSFLFFRRGFDLWRWDLSRGRAEKILRLPESTQSLNISPNGTQAVLVSFGPELKALSLETKRPMKVGQLPTTIAGSQANLSIDGWLSDEQSFLLTVKEAGSGLPSLWKVRLGESKIERLNVPAGYLSADGKKYAYFTERQSKLWLAETADWQGKILAEAVFVSGRLAWSADGQRLFAVLAKPEEKLTELVMIEVSSGKITWRQEIADGVFPRAWAPSPDGSRVAVWFQSLANKNERQTVLYPVGQSGKIRRWTWSESENWDWQIGQTAFVKDELCFTTMGVKPNLPGDSTPSAELSSKLWCLADNGQAKAVSSEVGLMAVIE